MVVLGVVEGEGSPSSMQLDEFDELDEQDLDFLDLLGLPDLLDLLDFFLICWSWLLHSSVR